MHLGVVGSDPAAPSNPGLKLGTRAAEAFGEGELLVMVVLVLIQEDNSWRGYRAPPARAS